MEKKTNEEKKNKLALILCNFVVAATEQEHHSMLISHLQLVLDQLEQRISFINHFDYCIDI